MRVGQTKFAGRGVKILCVAVGLSALAGCEEFSLSPSSTPSTQSAPSSVKTLERDVESPDVFQASEQGLWDGRPSLGGVWVAHPDVSTPERVVIRNPSNGKFVIGALFRKERDMPGPSFQVSSDAAKALGLLAGAPAELNVTALRRQEVEEATAAPATETPTTGETADVAAAEAALSEINADPITVGAAPGAAATASTPSKPATKASSTLSKPYLQVGIFSQKANAQGTASSMRKSGLTPEIFESSSSGKTFYRVVVGPALTQSEQNAMLKMVRSMGFKDAYAVSK